MTASSQYVYPSPLKGYEHLPQLSDERNDDGNSLVNSKTNGVSKAYEDFVAPIKGGFDVHIYFFQTNEIQTTFANELWTRIRYEFPELRISRVWDRPIGPHPLGMFEVDVLTPAQFGAFVAWLVINRGPLSALVHPNTDDHMRDHTQRATWLGDRLPLDLSNFPPKPH
ncbi:DOPA-like domain-containing protein [Usnea florida]